MTVPDSAEAQLRAGSSGQGGTSSGGLPMPEIGEASEIVIDGGEWQICCDGACGAAPHHEGAQPVARAHGQG